MITNESSFSHHCHYGTMFVAKRCDFRGGVQAIGAPKDKAAFASDVAEMIGYHAVNIRPELNGFSGYDCITWHLTKN